MPCLLRPALNHSGCEQNDTDIVSAGAMVAIGQERKNVSVRSFEASSDW